jgi:hypothetical protein
MKLLPTTLLAGVASVALAGTVAAHTLTVQLPDGTTEQINYAGDVAPQISFIPAGAAVTPDWFGPDSPFAVMQQISAAMDREAAAMMRNMQALALQPMPGPGQPIQVDLSNLPPGTESYSFVSTMSPGSFCSQSTEIIAKGPGLKPQVITHRSGNCAPGAISGVTNATAPKASPALRPARPPARSYQTNAAGHGGYHGMLEAASW